MKQTTNPQPAFFWLLLATLFLSACGGKDAATDQAALQRSLAAANELLYEGEVALALSRLEALEQEHPGNPDIVEALAFAYAKQPDPGMAAIYFDQAHTLNPENTDLALYAAQAYRDSGNFQGAAQSYRAYLNANPGDAVALKSLARAEAELNRNKAALDAFLEAIRVTRQKPAPEEAALIGHLYHALNNTTQAERWYQSALTPDAAASDRLTAHLGLFDIALREEDWPRAYERMKIIEEAFPGELVVGPYAESRKELIEWKQAQDALAATRISGATPPAQEEPEQPPRPEDSGPAENESVAAVQPNAGRAPQNLGNLSDDPVSMKGEPVSVDLTADVQAAIDPEPSEDAGALTVDEIETIDNESGTAGSGEAPAMTITTDQTITNTSPSPPSPPPPAAYRSAADRGDLAYEAEDYLSAVRFYRQALANDSQNADLAYRLSRAYYNQGQYREAELFASEAVRLDRDDVRYTLNYLRAIQRTMGRDALMRELIRAKERFPTSPDITLALGRAYEVIMGNTRNARFLYEEFLTLAPQHPRAEDIRAKLRELPR